MLDKGWLAGWKESLRLEDYTYLKTCACAEVADNNGGKRSEEERYEAWSASRTRVFCPETMYSDYTGLPMDIERPPTNAKSIGFAPGKVSELR